MRCIPRMQASTEVLLEKGRVELPRHRLIKTQDQTGKDLRRLWATRPPRSSRHPSFRGCNLRPQMADSDISSGSIECGVMMLEHILVGRRLLQITQSPKKHLQTPICSTRQSATVRADETALEIGAAAHSSTIKLGRRAGGHTSARRDPGLCLDPNNTVWCWRMLECGIGGLTTSTISSAWYTCPAMLGQKTHWERGGHRPNRRSLDPRHDSGSHLTGLAICSQRPDERWPHGNELGAR